MPTIGTAKTFLAAAADTALDGLLRQGLADAKAAKARLLESLQVVRGSPPIQPTGSPGAVTSVSSSIETTNGKGGDDIVSDLFSKATFDATTGITVIDAKATFRQTGDELASILDPRSWSASGGPIAAAFLVEEGDDGLYSPITLETRRGQPLPLGQPFANQLLYEYARSQVASFENILKITNFEVTPDRIRADYHLHECLVFMLGLFSAPGGLIVNEGYVEAKKQPDGRFRMTVLKKVQVQDLTPNDAGNPFDFGESVNSVMGAALSEWVHDTSLLHPLT